MRIKKGISKKNIEELIKYSNSDERIRKFTSDGKRFASKKSFGEWRKKKRVIYSLIDEKENLMGISWFGKEGEGFTLAVRVYGEARGKGLSESFLSETMVDFMKSEEYLGAENKNWWLETSVDNLAAIKLYEKLGFEKFGEGKSVDKVIFRRHHDFESEKNL